ncbi:superoxide dismutase family protein [Virgibacillus sp. MSJ-26]|uniref:superoxide dismutase family protein n=1 Tax=Virgibacillus sp. MSJ-26 TaxID=2841522 RepID=UPI001C109EEB|nr:superoxide dismutase family protein [Virgibacillus sp. MSJ-26]MBU5467220.1 superoxide dismutase family protein [Virgibacillus sp. MSJ-26]
MRRWLISLILVLILSACQSGTPNVKEIDIYNSSADMIGTAKLSEQEGGVQVKLEVNGLSPGFHGVHIHEFGKCEGPDFKSSGNHFNPDGKEHGLMHPEGSHIGDLPNIEADSSGYAEAELMADEATFTDGKNSLLKEDGTSLVITADKDDGVNQPGGKSGERVACGIIKKDAKAKEGEEPTDPAELEEEEKEEE